MPEITMNREMLHIIARRAGSQVGLDSYVFTVNAETALDFADKLAHATAAPGELTIKVVG